MFPEYQDLIARIKAEGTHARALNLMDRHEELDRQITDMEAQNAGDTHAEIGALKKEKLRVKDELHALLQELQAAA